MLVRYVTAVAILSGVFIFASVQTGSARPGHGGWGEGHGGWGEGDGGGRGHNGAPAPLLAAGLPAFAALGAGAGIRFLVRRRRSREIGD